MINSTLRILLGALAVTLVTLPAGAEPLTVTSGFARFKTGDGYDMFFGLKGEGFLVEGEVYGDDFTGSQVTYRSPPRLENGVPASASAHWLITRAWNPSTPAYWAGEFTFQADPILLSCQFDEYGEGGCSGGAPFRFSGTLNGFDTAGQQRVRHDLLGRGQASVTFYAYHGPVYMSYVFEDASPIPEPGTILMFVTGLGALARRAWKRRTTLVDAR